MKAQSTWTAWAFPFRAGGVRSPRPAARAFRPRAAGCAWLWPLLAGLWCFGSEPAVRGDLLISEFMAVNGTTLNDEDGDNSDWIEIHNPDLGVANLAGWYLTDTTNRLTKWQFPATNLPPGGYLVVFASEKNRRTPGAPLHTNFRLASNGEYLALVHPDGTNVAWEVRPAYPLQVADVSYGVVRNALTVSLVGTNAPVRALVPTSGALGLSWTEVEFGEAEWLTGTTGVGYDRQTIGVNYLPLLGLNIETAMYNSNASLYVRLPFVVGNPEELASLTLRMRFEDGFVAYLNGIEVARSNAPASLTWNSAATTPRSDTVATNAVEYDLTAERGYLHVGTNLLAFHVLNNPVNSPDLLLLPQLLATVPRGLPSLRYFPTPTPGRANNAGVEILGPLISEATHTPSQPTDAQDLVVTARIRGAFAPVGSATLRYRVMFGSEVSLPFLDDGLHGDGAAGDGVYGGVIPATAASPGQMVRWYLTARDTGTNSSRLPCFTDTNNSPAYLGTLVANPALTNALPVFHWFVQDATGVDGGASVRASVFYQGEFYDNVLNRWRGASAPTFPKKPYKFDFNPNHHFRVAPGLPRVEEVNLNATYQDKAYVRQPLAFETYQQAGVPACDAFPVRVERNGSFYSVAVMVEQVDETFLERRGLDRNAALYKIFQGLTSATTGVEKKTRRQEDNRDLQQLVDGLAMGNPRRGTNLFDLLDLPEIINYLAAGAVAMDWDRVIKNIYLYRDTEGTQLWQMFPWDKDLSFGKTGLVNDSVTATKDGTVGVSGEPYVSHPFYGMAGRNCCGVNHLFDAVFTTRLTREMFLRRLRSLMDEILQPPGTPANELGYEARVDALVRLLRADAALDLARWGAGYGVLQDLDTATTILKTDYFAPRRVHLYQTHSLAAVTTNAAAVGIPPAQAGAPMIRFGVIEFNPTSGDQAQEYLELVNPNSTAVDLSGWRLDGGVRFTFTPGTVIPAGGHLYVSPNVVAFRSRASAPRGGQGLFVVGNYEGQLSARGELLQLISASGVPASATNYPGQPSPAQEWLRITEIMYHPAPPPPGSTNDPESFAYLELKNTGTALLDLRGVRFSEGIEFAFGDSGVTHLAAGDSVLVVKDLAAFQSRYTGDRRVAGECVGSLRNAGERLRLVDAMGEEVLDFAYNNAWYPVTDGLGFSLVVNDPMADPAAWNEKTNWRPSGRLHGSPGAEDPPPPGWAPVLVNEVLSNTDPPLVDALELYNPSAAPADVGGWFITDDVLTPGKFRIPDGTWIAPGGFAVFCETNFNPQPGVPPSFAFSSDGDEAYLFSADPAGNLTGYAHGFRFGAAASGISFGRHLTSMGQEHFVAQAAVTLGATNSLPKVGPVVLSEIMYHPPDLGGTDNTLEEYIELQNIGPEAVAFSDPVGSTNTWQLRGTVSFAVPTHLTLPAGQTLLLVSFDPTTNGPALAQFRAAYALGGDVPVLGPYDGKLHNQEGVLELWRPSETNLRGETVPVLVETVHYQDTAPWPAAADGDGSSLQRFPASAYGDDPAHWFAAGRTPGAANGFNLPPTVRLTSPAEGAVFNQPANLTLTAEAHDTNGTVTLVEFFSEAGWVGEATVRPFSIVWTNAPSGAHVLTAKAHDDSGATALSAPVRVSVLALPPCVTLCSPTNGAVLVASEPVTLVAAPTDPDGIVTLVEFFDGATKLGETSALPHTWTWTNAAVGRHALRVRATDNAGLQAASSVSDVIVVAGSVSHVTLVAQGSTWKYWAAGLDLGEAWRSPSFNDLLWPAGPAELGYGDSEEGRPEATPIGYGPNPASKYITTYFRREFQVSGAAALTDLQLRVLRDDGAVVYLNGAEIFRTGMAAGPVAFGTLANEVVAGDEESVFHAAPIGSGTLTEGTNLMAVEVHQRSADSSDLSFDLELTGLQTFVAPFITADPAGGPVAKGRTLVLQVGAIGTAPLSYQWGRNGTNLPGSTASVLSLPAVQFEDTGTYFVRVSNRLGMATSLVAQVTVFAQGDYAANVLVDRPIHYYRLEETQGTTTADAGIPGGKTGVLAGGVTLGQPSASPILGRAARFEGASGTYVDLGLFHPGDSLSLEAWLNLDPAANNNPSYNAIVARWDGSFELDLAPGDFLSLVVRNEAGDMGVVTTLAPLQRGQWYHVAGSYQAGLLQLYLNGSLTASAPFPGTLRNAGPVPDRVLLGATRDGASSSFQWKGLLDEVAIYDRALTPIQVWTHFLGAAPAPVALSLSPAGVLAWPSDQPGYLLQVTESLRAPVAWREETSPRVLAGGFYRVTVPMGDPQRFYRLIWR